MQRLDVGRPDFDRLTGAGYHARMRTPFAVLGIRTAGEWLVDIDYLPRGAATLDPVNALAAKVCRQIERYLDDPQFPFDLPHLLQGTPFQCNVWREIAKIPAGSTATYLAVAKRIGSAPRPVGVACGANRVPLIVPCHRVVASGGIGGFMKCRTGAPLDIKRWLLRHESSGER